MYFYIQINTSSHDELQRYTVIQRTINYKPNISLFC